MRKTRVIIILLIMLSLFASIAFACKEDVIVKYTLEFETFGGVAIDSVQYEQGAQIELPTPEWPNYEFVGWYSDEGLTNPFDLEVMPAKRTKIYALFIPESKMRIAFDTRGGSAVEPIILNKNALVPSLPSPERANYEFDGWYNVDDQKIEAGMVLSGSQTLYAKWIFALGNIQISYYANGVLAHTDSKEAGNTFADPELFDSSKYEIGKWTTEEGDEYDFDTVPLENISLYIEYYSKNLVLNLDRTIVSGFNGTQANTDIVLPSTVEAIAPRAFQSKSVVRSVRTFKDLKTIGEYAFSSCTNLAEFITSENSITHIGAYAFSGCSKLTSIDVSNVQDITSYAFNNCAVLAEVIVGDALKTIGDYAFNGCRALDSIQLNDGILSIGTNAFANCIKIPSIILPKTLNTIGDNAFLGMNGLTEMSVSAESTSFQKGDDGNIYSSSGDRLLFYNSKNKSETAFSVPDGVVCIDTGAFIGNTALRSVSLPASVENAFSIFTACPSLTSITLSNMSKITHISYLYGATAAKGKTSLVLPTALKTITFSGQPTIIPDYAFYGCDSLTSITGLDSVIRIGAYAFAYTKVFESFVISRSVESIGVGAFAYSSIRNYSIDAQNQTFTGTNYVFDTTTKTLIAVSSDADVMTFDEISDVEFIGDYAFWNCSKLTELVLPSSAKVMESVFAGCTGLRRLSLSLKGVLTANTTFDALFGGSTASLDELIVLDEDEVLPEAVFNFCNIKIIRFSGKVKVISALVFSDNTALEEIYGLNNVERIEGLAFMDCTSLKIIGSTSNDGLESLEYLGSSAFAGADSLTTFTVPVSLETIASQAFYGCNNLTTLSFADYDNSKLSQIGDDAFWGCPLAGDLVLPNSLERIGGRAFANVKITTLSFGGSLDSMSNALVVADNAFTFSVATQTSATERAKADTNLTLADFSFTSLKTMGASVFYAAQKLETVIFPTDGSFVEIGDSCFYNCFSLINITIPESVIRVGLDILRDTRWQNEKAWNGDTGIYFKDHVAVAFYGSIEQGATITFPASYNDGTKDIVPTVIASNFFWSGVVFDQYGNQQTSSGVDCYMYNFVGEIVIAPNYEYINSYAFLWCFNLTKLTIGNEAEGSALKAIGARALTNLSNLKTVILYADNAPVLSSAAIDGNYDYDVFMYSTNVILYVPNKNAGGYQDWTNTGITLKNISEWSED